MSSLPARTQPLRKRRKSKKASRRRYADRMWADLIKAVGRCAVDGCTDTRLEAAHLVPRRFMSVRHSLDNGVALCHDHHAFYTAHPYSWDDWVTERIGADAYLDLKRRAEQRNGPPDYDEIIERLKAARKETG